MAQAPSRPKRWADAIRKGKEGCDYVREAFNELQELKTEYEEWKDNLPENLQNSELANKLEAIVDMDFDESQVEDCEGVFDEAESAELPQGFGRD